MLEFLYIYVISGIVSILFLKYLLATDSSYKKSQYELILFMPYIPIINTLVVAILVIPIFIGMILHLILYLSGHRNLDWSKIDDEGNDLDDHGNIIEEKE